MRKSLEEYKLGAKDELKTIGIDFDGVLHDNHKGFCDGTIYGNPIQGSRESIKFLSNHFKLIVYSAKARKDRPLINNKNGEELIWEWLKKNGLDAYIASVESEKPRAALYIDDRAIRFVTWHSTLEKIKECGLL